jgi:hypothetical protein
MATSEVKPTSWNYRVVEYDNGHMAIYEVYYDQHGEPWASTETPVKPCGDDLTELAGDIRMMAEALTKPIIPNKERLAW